jgi:FixJ family two-component response regulator
MSGGDRSFDGNTYLELAHNKGAHLTIEKPFTRQDILKAVRELLDGRNSQPGVRV